MSNDQRGAGFVSPDLAGAFTRATVAVNNELASIRRGAVTITGAVLHSDGSPASATLTGPDGSLDLRVDRTNGQPKVHLISAGFPQHGLPDPIDTQLGVNLGATVIGVPDADLRAVVEQAAPILHSAQRALRSDIARDAAATQTEPSTRQLNGDIDFDSNGDPRLNVYAIRAAGRSRVLGVGEPYLSSQDPSTAALWRSGRGILRTPGVQVSIALADAAITVTDAATGESLNARQVADRLALVSPHEAVQVVQHTAYQLRRGQVVNNTTIDRQRHEQLAHVQAQGPAGMQWPEQDSTSGNLGASSTAHVVMAETNANLAIDGAASTATLADDGDAAAARVAALGARSAVMSQGRGSLDPHTATQVAVAASTRTRQRLQEVYDMVDQVAAQHAATPTRATTTGTSSPAVAPRYTDRTDYTSPCVDTNAPTQQQG